MLERAGLLAAHQEHSRQDVVDALEEMIDTACVYGLTSLSRVTLSGGSVVYASRPCHSKLWPKQFGDLVMAATSRLSPKH
jgi:hypothetical protein